ncbi:methionyl-tRNA formyltransferase [Adlercreutzia sp. R25]|uniref:Methionyl-tRNA formyltransferase n=1 Tax=Adlercreutzia shanghongiae TaxID=3111773 RepID=A0ABU6IX81_9ACTN|nr:MULTISPECIES: methionyl-tRNA formyltransferase [unclassified Adlercreutzia]MEC4272351.1 methionyl-tRNA formyltransferase [Adlercreutzia sp. R25]MEC4294217.1 methionyl-tRNA formyltransferase [Adlercreutzia sp. R22]
MRVVFMGTPQFAAEILDEVAECHEVVAVYTRPDAVRGRGRALVPSPVKEVAERRGLPVRCPRTLRDAEALSELAAFKPDAICVAAYGAILPKEVLELPRYGCLNVHGSLLPRWRGAAPIERAILAGDEEIGVCIMAMEEGLDTGDFCVCRSVPAGALTAAELTDELAALGASALLTALAQAEAGNLRWVAQDEAQVTYAEKIAKGELNLDPAEGASLAWRKVRASNEAHPAKCSIAGKTVTVLAASPAEGATVPEGAAALIAKRLYLGFADGALEVTELKPDGKKAMAATAFAAGVPALRAGEGVWTCA